MAFDAARAAAGRSGVPIVDDVGDDLANAGASRDVLRKAGIIGVEIDRTEFFEGGAAFGRDVVTTDAFHSGPFEHGVVVAHVRQTFDVFGSNERHRGPNEVVAEPAAAKVRMDDEPAQHAEAAVQLAWFAHESPAGGLVAQGKFERAMGIDHDAQGIARGAVAHDEDLVHEAEFGGGAVVHRCKMGVVSLGPAGDDEASSETECGVGFDGAHFD